MPRRIGQWTNSTSRVALLNHAQPPLQNVTLTHRPCATSFLCLPHRRKRRPTVIPPYPTPARTPRCYPAQCSTARSPPPTRTPLSSDGSGSCISSCPISPFRRVRGNTPFSVRNARIAGRGIARSLRCRGKSRPGAASMGKGRIRSWWRLCSGGRGLCGRCAPGDAGGIMQCLRNYRLRAVTARLTDDTVFAMTCGVGLCDRSSLVVGTFAYRQQLAFSASSSAASDPMLRFEAGTYATTLLSRNIRRL